MGKIGKIAGLNILVMLVYLAILCSYLFLTKGQTKGGYANLDRLLIPFGAIVIHAILAIIVSIYHFINKNTSTGQAYLISAGLVLVIGFSPCWMLLLFA